MEEPLEPPLPVTRYGTLEMAAEAAHLKLASWEKTKPWRDYLDACYAVACESPNWGLEPAWTNLVNEVKMQGWRR